MCRSLGQDLDVYLENHKKDSRAYINKASTCFPTDMEGVISNCNHALEIDPDNMNAYFLRGLAGYQAGKKEEACRDFYSAIELGFTVLKEAENQRCHEYWKTYTE